MEKNNEKKEELVNSILVIFATISLIVSGIMLYCGYGSNENNNNEKLKETFDENSLLIVEREEKIDDIDVSAFSIKGLKDEQVEKKINDQIKRDIEENYKGIDKMQWINCVLCGNFANILSFETRFCRDRKEDKSECVEKRICRNYDLNTGKEIEYEDIFTKSTDQIEFLHKAFYDQRERENHKYFDNSSGSNDMIKEEKSIKEFLNSKEKSFSISPHGIFIYANEFEIEILNSINEDSIIVYSKYLKGKDLYKDNNIGHKNLFKYFDLDKSPYNTIDYGYYSDNMWYELSFSELIDTNEETKDKEAHKKLIDEHKKKKLEELKEEIAKCAKEANENKDRFYMISISYYTKGLINDSLDDILVDEITICKDSMSLETFEKGYKDILKNRYMDRYVYKDTGKYVDDTLNTSDIQKEIEHEYNESASCYNYVTEKTYEKVSELFVEGYDYESVIKTNTYDQLLKRKEHSEEEIKEIMDRLEYEIDLLAIRTVDSKTKRTIAYVPYDNFDSEKMIKR